jgi:hypothetical protein
MLIEKIYNFIQFLKNQGHSQYFSPEEVISYAFNRASIDLYLAEVKEFEKTGQITDNLRNFKRTKDIDRDSNQKFLLPVAAGEEYFNATAVSSIVDGAEHSGNLYTDGEWVEANTSELLPPEVKYMNARIIKDEVQVKPDEVAKIRLYYLKQPVDAVYNYSLVSNKITFQEQGSVDPDWPITAHNQLIMRTLRYLGIAINDQVMVQAEDFIKQPATINSN